MIIQCEQCRTKFKLDDSKVPDKGVKVRCAKCRHVFSVVREQPETEPQAAFGDVLDSSVAYAQGEVELQPKLNEPDQDSAQFDDVPAAEGTAEFVDSAAFQDATAFEDSAAFEDATVFEDTSVLQSEYLAPDQASEIEFEDTAPSPDAPFAEHSAVTDAAHVELQEDLEDLFSPDISSADHSFDSVEDESLFSLEQVEPQASIDNIDFGEFTFSDENDDADLTSATSPGLDFGDAPKMQPPPITSQAVEFGGLDFSGDDLFGEVVPASPEESTEAIAFDFGLDDFASSMGVDDTASGQKHAFTITETSSDAPFSLDEIDFGDELTSVGVQHVNPEELQPSQELLFAPLAEAQAKPGPDADKSGLWKSPAGKEDLPPLSIASRRKQSPLFTGLFAAFGIIIIAVVAYFGYSMFAGDKGNMAQDTGRISVSEVDAKFVKNKLAGDLLVISGEAINEFSKPQAAIQIKGIVYGTNGEVLSSKNAFCGNPLTEEQLSTLSLDKIEAAMANQFGDSLANMEVAPGKAIPFVIVIAKMPEGGKDYGVEPAGSTVATGKQQ